MARSRVWLPITGSSCKTRRRPLDGLILANTAFVYESDKRRRQLSPVQYEKCVNDEQLRGTYNQTGESMLEFFKSYFTTI